HRRREPPAWGVDVLFLTLVLLLPGDIALIRLSRLLLGGVPGAFLSLPQQLLVLLLSVVPLGLILGILFQWAAKTFSTRSGRLASAYAWESLGGAAGGVCSLLLFKLGLQNLSLAVLCGLPLVLVPFFRRRRLLLRHLAVGGVGVLFLLAVFSPGLDWWLTAQNHPRLQATRDTPYGRITITGHGGQVSLFENDALVFESQGTSAEELVHLAALQCEQPARILILGGGLYGLLAEIAQYAPERVDDVELDPGIVELSRRYLPSAMTAPLDAPSVHLFVTDPRRFITTAGRYDLVLLAMPEPDSGQSNRFYTQEFFGQIARHLAPRGILALRLASSENVWTEVLARRNSTIYRALRTGFEEILVLPAQSCLMIASNSPLERDPKVLAERLASRSLKTRLVSAAYLDYLFTNDRFEAFGRRLEATPVPANSDLEPICYRYSILLWLSRLFPSLINWHPEWTGGLRLGLDVPTLAGLSLVVLGFGLIRRRRSWAGPTLMAAAAFVGMVLETVLLLHYQIKSGVLYQDIGLLLTLFMGGMALGALAIRRAAPVEGPISVRIGMALAGVLVAESVFYLLLIEFRVTLNLAAVAGLLLLVGFLVAGMFAFVSRRVRADERRLVSPLYAGDLLGGCLASLLASLVLVPFFGFEQSVLVALLLSLSALILVR
ncbi:MAG: hypothetical protein WAO20_00965, partial [Acidobacteriota bacterium]